MKQSITNYLTLTCIVLMFGSNLLAQNRTKILTPFYLNEVGLAYDSLPKPPGNIPGDLVFGYNGDKAVGSQNIHVDAEGNIMFFIVDGFIFDRYGVTMGRVSYKAPNHIYGYPHGDGANEWADGGFGETSIIPSPDCGPSNTYFIITTYRLFGAIGNQDGYSASWDKVVISYDNNGNRVAGSDVLSNEIFNGNPGSVKQLLFNDFIPGFGQNGVVGHCNAPRIAVSKVINGNKRYIYVLNQEFIYKLKIENDQLVYENYKVDLSSYFHNLINCNPSYKSEMELVSLNNGDLRLAFPINAGITIQDPFRPGYGILDFSPNTGNVITSSLKTVFYPILSSSGESGLHIKGRRIISRRV